ncbi:MAG: Eco57I restriction-modification methylase domain-containing protein [Candidatus Heimdallarchaeaceae archaeon]
MKNKSSSYEIIKKLVRKHPTLKEPNSLWMFIFHNLSKLSSDEDYLFSFFTKSSLQSFFSNGSENFENIVPSEDFRFSLDENLSSTHLTPFHLSAFDSALSSLKKKGQFFTPSYISHYIANQSISYFLKGRKTNCLSDVNIADIACGTGNLLISMLYALIAVCSSETDLKSEDIPDFITKGLYGFDLDPVALSICKLRILFFHSFFYPNSPLPTLSNHFALGNSLLKEKLNFQSLSKYFTQPLSLLSSKKKPSLLFDIIVSNPPYMVYGLRNSQNYHSLYKKYLRENYSSAEYKLSMFPMFIERSIQLLKKEGILGIITPDSYLLGRYYSKIRSFILQNSKILEIDLLGFEPFPNVSLGHPTISFFSAIKNESRDDFSNMFTANWIASKEIFENKNWESYPNNQDLFKDNSVNRFHLFFNKHEKEYVKIWQSQSELTIEDVATIHTGIRSRIGQKNIIANESKGKYWKKGIISSSQVLPFYINYKGDWLNLDSANLWAGGYNRDIIENAKILIRQTGFHIITSVDTNGYYHLNNVHSLKIKDNSFNIYALSCILNSLDFNEFYHIKSMEKGRALAQIDIDFLLKMPIPDFSEQDIEILQEFYFENQKKKMDNKSIPNYKLEEIINHKIFQYKTKSDVL